MPSAHLSLGPTSCPNRVTEHECQGSQARDTNTDSSRRGHPSPQARAATSHMAFCSPLDAAQVWFSRRATGVCTRPALGDTHLQEATRLLMGAWGVVLQGSTPLQPLGSCNRGSGGLCTLGTSSLQWSLSSQAPSLSPPPPDTMPLLTLPPRGPCSQLALQPGILGFSKVWPHLLFLDVSLTRQDPPPRSPATSVQSRHPPPLTPKRLSV